MKQYIKSIFKLDRRNLLKLSAATSSLMVLPNFDVAYSEGECDKYLDEAIENIDVTDDIKGEDFYYWIDGPMSNQFDIGTGEDLNKTKMAVTVDIQSSEDKYVEAYFLTDKNNKIISSQIFSKNQALKYKYSPYGIFDNLNSVHLNSNLKVFVFIAQKNNESIVHSYEINSTYLRPSRLNFDHLYASARNALPKSFLDDMKNSSHGFDQLYGRNMSNDANDRGFISSQYADFTHPNHDVKAFIKDINAEGDFTFSIRMMHNDLDAEHYMRYFLVLDPVGRILGGRKRDPGQLVKNTIQYFDVKNFNKKTSNLINIDPPATNSSGDLNILDCPYVQVFTEDIRDAIARMTFRLV